MLHMPQARSCLGGPGGNCILAQLRGFGLGFNIPNTEMDGELGLHSLSAPV